ncbi:hypothetical protein CYMTET_46235 [Cymbomonas tetramitiformis]|uniref:Acyltransferase 3 domain-containing protein n=1 Tax=Cymbomonas tetramitiformis TaxID=36881 RepID=A0AAE0BYD2_9CHLO|nr:hypothetical protein CYMTET_46235 [Cymbomonas tetramitiformis]
MNILRLLNIHRMFVPVLASIAIHLLSSFYMLLHEVEMSDGTKYKCNLCGFGKYWLQCFFLLSGYVLYRSHDSSNAGPARSVLPNAVHPAPNATQPTSHGTSPDASDPAPATVVYNIRQQMWQHAAASGASLAKRGSVVYPLHAVAVLIAMIWRSADRSHSPVGAREAVSTLFLVQSWFEPYHWDLNGPSWFLSNMVLLWLWTPHWCQAAQRCGMVSAAGVAAGCWAASLGPHLACYHITDLALYKRWYGIGLHNFIEFHPLANWYCVAGGVFLARAGTCDHWRLPTVLRRWGISALLCAVLVFFSTATAPGFEMGTYELLIGKGPATLPVFGALIALSAEEPCDDWCGGRLLKSLSKVAWIAWPLYITHMAVHTPIRFLIRLALGGDTELGTFFMIPVLLLLAAGGLSILECKIRLHLQKVCVVDSLAHKLLTRARKISSRNSVNEQPMQIPCPVPQTTQDDCVSEIGSGTPVIEFSNVDDGIVLQECLDLPKSSRDIELNRA